MFLKYSPRQVLLHTAPSTYPPPPSSSHFCGGGPQIQGENQATQVARTVQYRGVLGTILTMVRTEGPRSPYNGLVAGLQRQMSFASIRIGLYDSVKQFYTPKGSDRECSRGIPWTTVGGWKQNLWVQRPGQCRLRGRAGAWGAGNRCSSPLRKVQSNGPGVEAGIRQRKYCRK